MELLLEQRRGFNLETHLAFISYVNAFDRVKKDKIFYISKSKNIYNLFLAKNNRNFSGKI